MARWRCCTTARCVVCSTHTWRLVSTSLAAFRLRVALLRARRRHGTRGSQHTATPQPRNRPAAPQPPRSSPAAPQPRSSPAAVSPARVACADAREHARCRALTCARALALAARGWRGARVARRADGA
eukprot:3574677-Prymnesium_polylepis.1